MQIEAVAALPAATLLGVAFLPHGETAKGYLRHDRCPEHIILQARGGTAGKVFRRSRVVGCTGESATQINGTASCQVRITNACLRVEEEHAPVPVRVTGCHVPFGAGFLDERRLGTHSP